MAKAACHTAPSSTASSISTLPARRSPVRHRPDFDTDPRALTEESMRTATAASRWRPRVRGETGSLVWRATSWAAEINVVRALHCCMNLLVEHAENLRADGYNLNFIVRAQLVSQRVARGEDGPARSGLPIHRSRHARVMRQPSSHSASSIPRRRSCPQSRYGPPDRARTRRTGPVPMWLPGQ